MSQLLLPKQLIAHHFDLWCPRCCGISSIWCSDTLMCRGCKYTSKSRLIISLHLIHCTGFMHTTTIMLVRNNCCNFMDCSSPCSNSHYHSSLFGCFCCTGLNMFSSWHEVSTSWSIPRLLHSTLLSKMTSSCRESHSRSLASF